MFYKYQLGEVDDVVQYTIYLLILCLLVLSISESIVFKSLTIVDLFISSFGSLKFCYVYFEALGMHTFKTKVYLNYLRLLGLLDEGFLLMS